MGDRFVLAIDCGTQSLRSMIFDDKGNIVGKERVYYEAYYTNYPGWAEQDPDLYWDSICKTCNKLKEDMPEIFGKIEAVTITTQRLTSVNVDKEGNPLRHAILWMDQRMAECKEPLRILDNLKFYVVGMKKAIDVFRKQSKSNWIRENQPEIWEKTYKYLLLSGYLTFKMSGKFVDSTASQIGYIPFDYKKFEWIKSNLNFKWQLFGIERDKLPEIVDPGEVMGYVTEKAASETGIKAGTPIISAGSDKGCETLGCGCLTEEMASVSFGTTATVQVTTKKYFEANQFLPAYPASIKGYYNSEIQIFRGYWMITWFKKEFAAKEMVEAKRLNVSPESLLNERLNEIPPGSQGLILNPYWGGNLKTPEAKGAIIGFGDVHTRTHIYRAIIEGINYGIIEGLEKIQRKSGTEIERIVVSGGGSSSDVICQITADMLNKPVLKPHTYEASGLGAAINGFVGLGVFKTYKEAVGQMVRYPKIFYPDRKNVEIYSQLYNRVYKKIYSSLKPLYDEIQKITNYPTY